MQVPATSPPCAETSRFMAKDSPFWDSGSPGRRCLAGHHACVASSSGEPGGWAPPRVPSGPLPPSHSPSPSPVWGCGGAARSVPGARPPCQPQSRAWGEGAERWPHGAASPRRAVLSASGGPGFAVTGLWPGHGAEPWGDQGGPWAPPSVPVRAAAPRARTEQGGRTDVPPGCREGPARHHPGSPSSCQEPCPRGSPVSLTGGSPRTSRFTGKLNFQGETFCPAMREFEGKLSLVFIFSVAAGGGAPWE